LVNSLQKLTTGVSRVAGVEDPFSGKAQPNYTNLCWGGAVATSAARCVGLHL